MLIGLTKVIICFPLIKVRINKLFNFNKILRFSMYNMNKMIIISKLWLFLIKFNHKKINYFNKNKLNKFTEICRIKIRIY